MAASVSGPSGGPPGLSGYASLTDDDLVTGEAVALDLPAANFGHRVVSGVIDVVVTMVLLIVVLWVALTITLPVDEAVLRIGLIGGLVAALVGFPTTLETLTRGRSLGKLAMGLRVVRDDGGPISFQHAFVRALLGVVEIYGLSGSIAVLSSMLNTRGKRLGDFVAGTYVVRDRVSLQLTRPVDVPFPLRGWAQTADVAALPTGLALAVRQFLARAHAVDPEARWRQASALAAQVQGYVAPPPPAGTPPDAFLAAVVGTRRDRDARRLQREAVLRHRLATRR
ncbi:RDD family protein [Nocardioides sp.]|uniref:RDD family protein n=1 Tax=Nocardioides sp. TaxID=35761 RepID=UPI003527A239